MRRALAPVALALLVAGCSANPAPDRPAATTTPAPLTAAGLAQTAGCAQSAPLAELPLFVQDAADCADAKWTNVSFYVGNTTGRDAWIQAAQTFGDRGVIKGDRWVVEIPDDLPDLDAVAAEIAGRLGGERIS